MIYFDAAYLAKCYLPEDGHHAVRALAERAGRLHSVAFARLEVSAVFHRHLREGRLHPKELGEYLAQFAQDCSDGIITFSVVSTALVETAAQAYRRLPASIFLRSADCLHLCAAAEAGFKEIYSNDRHLLAAASCFKLKGIDVTSVS
ncbi:MAG: type II toxin-antitoxin system VapC family toxin [Opitutaceae bacterium]|nr:type II toxin-antitoxin system VapC family toxin [Opitutaceae bacterium]